MRLQPSPPKVPLRLRPPECRARRHNNSITSLSAAAAKVAAGVVAADNEAEVVDAAVRAGMIEAAMTAGSNLRSSAFIAVPRS